MPTIFSVSTAFNTFELGGPAVCEASCFAATKAVSTVPYFSLGEPRNVTLIYNGDQVAARPFIYADAYFQSTPSGFQEYWLEAKDSSGAYITFVNGDTRLRFVPTTTSQRVRLVGEFDAVARGYTTGVYPITIIATANYASGVEVQTFATKFMVINERSSSIARGWTVAGVQRLYAQGAGALITAGDGSAVFFTSAGGYYWAPQGEYSTLSSSGSGTGLTYTRNYPDGSQAIFNYVGRLTYVISRLQDTLAFDYDAALRLSKIYDPYRTNGAGVHLYTSLSYGSSGLSAIQEPGPFNSQAGGRVTNISVLTDSTLNAFTHPDNVSTRFTYDGQRRLFQVINRRGDTTTFYSNAVTWKVDSMV